MEGRRGSEEEEMVEVEVGSSGRISESYVPLVGDVGDVASL